MGKVLTIGEPMCMFVAKSEGKLKNVKEFERFVAGAEVNVSVGVSRLGHLAQYITSLGQDPFGEYIFDFLNSENIDTSLISFNSEAATGFQLKGKDSKNDPEVVYFRKGSAASQQNENRLEEIKFKDIDLLHITGILMALNDGTFNLVKTMILKAKELGIVVTFDPNLRPTLWKSQENMIARINEIASLVDYILPGLSEGELLTGKMGRDEIADFYLNLGVKSVIIKCGPEGAYAKWVTDESVETAFVSGFKLDKVVDTVGAGDGFAVGIITGILENLEMNEMLVRANAIGAIQVCHISDNENLPSSEQLETFIKSYDRASLQGG
ncbi:MAG: sugar kinase [Streptococcaceae bacterium]|jgi:2-dehydro-3-deoxygluconokinase|nr:sugar kinase [Streptococcaceae bacterium]